MGWTLFVYVFALLWFFSVIFANVPLRMKVRYLCPASFSFAMMDATYLMA
jgi:hypothetical protein